MGFSGGGELKDIFKIQCYVAAWMGEEFEGEWIQEYVWLSPFAVHLKLSQCC